MASSLEDFAHKTSAAGRCAVCNLGSALRAQIDGAAEKGIGSRVTASWLASLGHTISRHQVDRHRKDNHNV